MLGSVLQLNHFRFLPHPFQITIHNYPLYLIQ
jgi:hypothetical protein